jgi:hypothetical protein
MFLAIATVYGAEKPFSSDRVLPVLLRLTSFLPFEAGKEN